MVLFFKVVEVCSIFIILCELGFKIVLDDFGIGYLSFNYIYSYLIDCIKIDVVFVCNLFIN